MSEKSFFLVWSPTGQRPPSYRHTSFGSAAAEAERLADINGGPFYVLQAVSCSRKVTVSTERLLDELDDLPF